jgi:hypothetical protein
VVLELSPLGPGRVAPIEPFAFGMLAVVDGNNIYWSALGIRSASRFSICTAALELAWAPAADAGSIRPSLDRGV